MTTTPIALLGLGFLLGVRHALDIDHVAAVSTIVSQRRSLRSSSLAGALWGLGHTAALVVVATAVVALHAEIPPGLARGLELGVAVMLVGLGLNLLRTLRAGGRLPHHPHGRGGRPHAHPHVHAPDHAHGPATQRPGRGNRRSFVVGLVHGLAGSAGLMLAVVATIPSPALALVYVILFGAGSIGGMALMSALISLPVAFASGRLARAEGIACACAAVGSVAAGLLLAWEIGIETGVLL